MSAVRSDRHRVISFQEMRFRDNYRVRLTQGNLVGPGGLEPDRYVR